MYLILPLTAALSWAFCYVYAEKMYQSLSISTFYVIGGVLTAIVGWTLIPRISGENVDFRPVLKRDVLWLLVVTLIAGKIACLCTDFAIKNVSATYASIGEIAYPLFIPVLAYVIFKDNQVNPPMILGGFSIIAGLCVIMISQSSLTKPPKSQPAIQIAGHETKADVF